jgi:hypothetical protein
MTRCEEREGQAQEYDAAQFRHGSRYQKEPVHFGVLHSLEPVTHRETGEVETSGNRFGKRG